MGPIVLSGMDFGAKKRKKKGGKKKKRKTRPPPPPPRPTPLPFYQSHPEQFRDSPCWPEFRCSRCQWDAGGLGFFFPGWGQWQWRREGGGRDEAPSLYRSKHWLEPSLGPHDMHVNVAVTHSFFWEYGKKTAYLIITLVNEMKWVHLPEELY